MSARAKKRRRFCKIARQKFELGSKIQAYPIRSSRVRVQTFAFATREDFQSVTRICPSAFAIGMSAPATNWEYSFFSAPLSW